MWNNIDDFCSYICGTCTANDWYCPNECDFLEKARNYPIERINRAFDDCGEDFRKLKKRIISWV